MAAFKDYSSGHAVVYADARPHYSAGLFAWLATLTPQQAIAWGCAAGNGQAAVCPAEHFQQVIATVASPQQIENVFPHACAVYRVAAAIMFHEAKVHNRG